MPLKIQTSALVLRILENLKRFEKLDPKWVWALRKKGPQRNRPQLKHTYYHDN